MEVKEGCGRVGFVGLLGGGGSFGEVDRRCRVCRKNRGRMSGRRHRRRGLLWEGGTLVKMGWDSHDTSGAVVKLVDFLLQAGSRDLLSFRELSVLPRDRVGLVGPNGAGKSTLLRAIAGNFPIAQGRIAVAPNKTIGYLPQQAVSGSDLTVWNEASSQMERLNRAEKDLRAAEMAVADNPSNANLKWLDDSTDRFGAAGGYAKDEKIGGVLTGLGFTQEDWKRKCSELSGGWGMRVALARLLLSEPDVMLLDEPTNHLDVRTKAYLRAFLAAYPYSIVVVSHDRQVLDDASRIVELRGGSLDFYSCNYSRFLELREQREAMLLKEKQRQDTEIAKLDSFITRFGAKATKAASAQSKQKALDKLEAKRVVVPTSTSGPQVRLRLLHAPPCASSCIELTKAEIGWPTGPVLLKDVSFTLSRGMRLAILGKNGGGKSTLMRSLAGMLPLRGGARSVPDERVSVGVFTQDLAADLPEDRTALEYLESLTADKTVQEIRSALGHLGLSGDAALRRIEYLSGGEKARVALAAFTLCSFNVLMLDEPSNHLDMPTVDVLIEALKEFEGAMVLVTHDRRLVESIATHILVVEGTGTTMYDDVSSKALDNVAEVFAEEASANMLIQKGQPEDVSVQEKKKARKEADKMRKKLPVLEKKIARLEEQQADLQAEMILVGDKPGLLADLYTEDTKIQAELESLYEEYMLLEESIEEVTKELSVGK